MFREEFIHYYSWGVTMKYHMGVYTAALVFTDCIAQWLMGRQSIPILVLGEMLLVSMGVAVLESWIFPRREVWEGEALIRRTALWALVSNLGFVGGAALCGWFDGVPLWGTALLALFLEFGLASMWFADHVALRRDTQRLNERLRQYQNE